ncbi:MAG TPA: amino acid ABC transporter permease [Stellaceae bacterium]|nr:amino acid ABC transporter permease [Stellaceae bacterium]HEV2302222.1 amino acid ABC transporter permease [Stellaceae bacterium]
MWDWAAFFHYLHSEYLLLGAGVTLGLSLASLAIGLGCGLAAALMRLSSNPFINKPASLYVWLMRGTPVLVQLIIIYTGLPQLGIKLNVLESALLGLGVNEGAYLAEIIRAGILSVPKGQVEAARAVGMTQAMTMRLVVLPQALRIIVPPLGNTFNGLLKTSSLASVISMEELLRRTEELVQIQFKVLEIFIVAALYYLLMTTVWGLIQERIEARLSRHVAPAGGRLRQKIDAEILSRDSQ